MDSGMINFYGFPVRSRVEMRGGDKETLILSVWDVDFFPEESSEGVMRMESSPMRVSKLKKDLEKLYRPRKRAKSAARGGPVDKTSTAEEKAEKSAEGKATDTDETKVSVEEKNADAGESVTSAEEETLGVGESGASSTENAAYADKGKLNESELAVLKFMGGKLDRVPTSATKGSSEEQRRSEAKQKQAEEERRFLLALGIRLPLAAILAAFWDRLLGAERRSKETVDEDRRVMLILLRLCGSIPWQEATPINCLPLWGELSRTRLKTCVRLMKSLHDLLYIEGVLIDDPWEDFQLPPQITMPSYASLVRGNIESVMLTDEQMHIVLEHCFLPKPPWNIRFAFFLAATQGVPLEEICGLNAGDIKPLNDYPFRLVAHIEHVYQPKEGNKNCSRMEITEEYRRRTLPLPRATSLFYDKHIKGLAPNSPLICNGARRMQPAVLKEKIEEFITPILREPFTDVEKISRPSAVKLLQRSAWEELRNSGYEEEELRYQRGQKPILTSAKSYCDFANPSQLNAMGSMQDVWLSRLIPQIEVKSEESKQEDALSHREESRSWNAGLEGRRTEVEITINLHSVSDTASDDGLILEFFANHALSGKVQYIGGMTK